jgi:putative transposase
MGRIARVVAVGLPHHVTQRGNNRAEVFFSDADRRYYLKTLAHYGDEFKLRVWAYCLMSNHVHILAVPEQEYSLAQGIGRTNLVYTQYVNRE